MKDNLPNIWHKHDGKGMPVYLQNDSFEVELRDGTKLKNYRQNWDWAMEGRLAMGVDCPYKGQDVIAWRYILPDAWNKTGPLTAEDFDGVVMELPKVGIQKYPEDNRLTKYQRLIRGKDIDGHVASVVVDVYDVLTAWEVQNQALGHMIKKALQPGERGHKSLEDDLKDIIASAQRALEIEQSKGV